MQIKIRGKSDFDVTILVVNRFAWCAPSEEKFKEDRISNHIAVYLGDFPDDFNLGYHLCVEVIILLFCEYVKNVLFHESR